MTRRKRHGSSLPVALQVENQNWILSRVVPTTVWGNITGLTSFQYFPFPLGNLYHRYKGITLEMTTTQEQNRNQQIIAPSRKASEISCWEPTVICVLY